MEIDYDKEESGDEFDWDQNNPAQRCKHGTFIGSWAGPDIMCHRCEEGY